VIIVLGSNSIDTKCDDKAGERRQIEIGKGKIDFMQRTMRKLVE